MAAESARLIIEVTAGLLHDQPDDSLTRRWTVTSGQWEEAERADAELLESGKVQDAAHAAHRYLLMSFEAAKADEYARLLRNPARTNWVRTEWVWL